MHPIERGVYAMERILTLMLLLLVLTQSWAVAETFRCERADGTVIYTDDPAKAPPGCEPQQVEDLPDINIVPAQPSPATAKPSRDKPSKAAQGHDQNSRSAEALEKEAETLATQFEATRTELYRSILAKDKQKARRELTEIRGERDRLQEELNRSSLNRDQKARIAEILSRIN